MAGNMFMSKWARIGPYLTKAYPDIWVGIGVIAVLYYKLSYGGKKAVKDKPAH